jgi:hypothetical protein
VADNLSLNILKAVVNADGSFAGSVRISRDLIEDTIRRHKLQGYAWANLRDYLSEEFANECRKKYVFQKLSGEKYFTELDRLSKIFADAGEAAIVYKGGGFMREFYGDLGARELKDFDLWVPPQKMKTAGKLFFQAGYEILEVPNWEAGEGKLIYTQNHGDFFTDFEVHQKNYSFEKTPLFSLPENARGFVIPPIEEHFLMTVIHAGYQHTFTELKWWIDIVRFLQLHNQNLNWEKLADLSHTHQMHRLLSNVLRVVAETQSWFKLRAELFSNIQLNSFGPDFLIKPQQDKLRYYWLKHSLKENIARTLRYDVLWLKYELEQKLFSN